MAKIRMEPVVDMTQVITAPDEETSINLSGKTLALVSSLLAYAATHGPAVYGTKLTRYNVPAYDQIIRNALDKVDFPVSLYTTWDKIKADDGSDKTVTLDGKTSRLVRALLLNAKEKGHNLLAVPNDPSERDEFDAMISSVISDLS